MSLAIPHYIEKTGVVSSPIAYTWDDDNPEQIYLDPDPVLQNRISDISPRGVVGLSLGFAEWIAWRLSKYAEHQILLALIEATWAGIVDWRYMSAGPDYQFKDWLGTVRGPIYAASELIWQVVHLTSTNQFAWPESVCLSRLAIHVLGPQPFREWRRFVIRRLAHAHPRGSADAVDRPVPREVLDPDIDYHPDRATQLIAKFLLKLDHTKNPYLSDPVTMKNEGFPGTPYTYGDSKPISEN